MKVKTVSCLIAGIYIILCGFFATGVMFDIHFSFGLLVGPVLLASAFYCGFAVMDYGDKQYSSEDSIFNDEDDANPDSDCMDE